MKTRYDLCFLFLISILFQSLPLYANTPNTIPHTIIKKVPLKLSVTPDTSICSGDSMELKAEASNAAGKVTYRWDQDLGEGNIQQVSPEKPTIFTVEARDEEGNTAIASIEVTVFERPIPNLSGEQLICPGINAQLDAGNFTAYQWSTGAKTRTIEITDDGDFSVSVQDENGCWGEAAFFIKERAFKNPKITGELGFCPGLTAKLDAGEFASYQWSTGDKTRTIEVGDDGFYSVTVQDENGCISYAKEKIIEYEPTFPIIKGDTFFCPGSTTQLNARGHFDFYAWSTGETTPVIHVGKEGVYRINVESEDGCLSENTISITELAPPKPLISGPSRLCVGAATTLKTGLFSQYLWSTGDTTQNIEINKSGTYSLTVTDEQGCSGETSLQIETIVPKITSIDAGPDQKIRPGEIIKLSTGKASKYLWAPAASLSCTDCRKPEATPLQTTTYYLTVWDKNGCSAQDSVTVTVLKE